MTDDSQKKPADKTLPDFGQVIPFRGQDNHEDDSAPSFGDVFDSLYDAGPWLALGSIVGLIGALVLLWVVPAKYDARMIIGPATSNAQGDLSASMPQGSVPVVNYMLRQMNSTPTTDFIHFEQLIISQDVAKKLATNPVIMRTIFANQWNDRQKTWSPPSGLMASTKQFFRTLIGRGQWAAPDAALLAEWMTHNLVIMPVGATTLREVRLRDPDPRFAAAFLKKLYDTTDEIIRHNARERTDAKIDYLKERLNQTANPLHRQAITNMLMEQEQVRTMVTLGLPFAANIVEHPSTGRQPVSPNPALLIPLLIFLGMGGGFLLYRLRQKMLWGL